MTTETPKELFEKGLITEDQYRKIDLIVSGKIVSVFYELRTLLYLGVMLLTAGIGILVYENIGEIGHIVAIIGLTLLTAVCFWYAFRNAPPYTNTAVKSPTPYFDYIVLLGSLLFISVQGYLQFQFGWLDNNLGISTLITAALFFFIAYRFDHTGVLSLAITALASFWSISVSPQKWYSGDFFSESNLHITALCFSVVVAVIAMILDRRKIKTHFTFTYLNFCLLIFFIAALAGVFIGNLYGIFLLLIYGGCVFAYYMARKQYSFLFMLYAFLAAYIGTTYFLAEAVIRDEIEIWFLYSLASCGGFAYFIVKYRNHFKQQS
ncbi:MAG TPA: DUF2157 domain-containing protein [Cyclobacteriaceae bacterium]|nr:DUF2157 domain-containing protein [Cyclobacteriaceae bacterium]